MTDNLEIDRLAEAVAWLKSGEAMMGPRTEVAVSVVLDKLASMIPAGGLAEEVRDAARWKTMRSLILASNTTGEYGLDYQGRRPCEDGFGSYVWKTAETIDAAIDSALSAPTPQQEQPR
jgi:hypothetical protein